MGYSERLPLSSNKIARCRSIAKAIGNEVGTLVRSHSTVGVERGVLRMLGMNGALERDELMYPVANEAIDQLVASSRIQDGALYWVAAAMRHTGEPIEGVERLIRDGKLDLGKVPEPKRPETIALAGKIARSSFAAMKAARAAREKTRRKLKDPTRLERPLLYQIVATGNIFEDVTQAKSSVLDGADVIAVIRSTAQSLLDYVPHGATTQGFGGTYATQENFRIMRRALDEVGEAEKKYIRLTNYCSGLCMTEIAVLAAFEGLDCLLNDAMYGILFRDINPLRTLIDQHFSRLVCARSGIWIMTGEDNYLKTTDAAKSGDQVLASQFINERTAINAGTPARQMALGHAMEMNPAYEKVILMELARAQMTRQIFPEAPLKYMCNTKYKTGDIFTSHVVDAVFNLIGAFTNQGVILLGMPTEAVHTPFLMDRSLSLRNANYITNGATGIGGELGFRSNGFIASYAERVLDDTVKLLETIERIGFLKAIEKGYFADVKRPRAGGKGATGVFPLDPDRYFNPYFRLLGSLI